MSDEKKKLVDSHTLFPEMMQGTKLLILDYDITRYHSFDLFRFLLLDKKMFCSCDQKFLPFVKMKDIGEQVFFYMRKNSNINPYDNFELTRDQYKITEYENRLNGFLNHPKMKMTPTDLDKRLSVLFERNNVTGFLLKYEKDPHIAGFSEYVKTYTSNHILDLRMALAIITKEQINSMILSSVDVAVLIAEALVKAKITHPITFMICSYYYNYDPNTNLMRHLKMMNILEYQYKHEFGLINPFTGLTQKFGGTPI